MSLISIESPNASNGSLSTDTVSILLLGVSSIGGSGKLLKLLLLVPVPLESKKLILEASMSVTYTFLPSLSS